jgi:hypothetical protein
VHLPTARTIHQIDLDGERAERGDRQKRGDESDQRRRCKFKGSGQVRRHDGRQPMIEFVIMSKKSLSNVRYGTLKRIAKPRHQSDPTAATAIAAL